MCDNCNISQLLCNNCNISQLLCDNCNISQLLCSNCNITQQLCYNCNISQLLCDNCNISLSGLLSGLGVPLVVPPPSLGGVGGSNLCPYLSMFLHFLGGYTRGLVMITVSKKKKNVQFKLLLYIYSLVALSNTKI